MMEKGLKLFLAVLLFGCLLKLPYGYYQLVRFLAMIAFAVLAYKANGKKEKNNVIIYISLAILFQPIVKIALGRTLWNIVDVLVGIYLVASALRTSKKNY